MTRECHVRFCEGLEVRVLWSTYLCEKPEIKYRFVYENCEYPVTKWAAMLEFSTSGYYDWLKTIEQRDKKQQDYEEAITNIFVDSGNTYGPDRVCGVLRKQGYTASYRNVSTIMKKLGFSSIHNLRRQRSLTNSKKARGKEWPSLIRSLKFFLYTKKRSCSLA